MQAGDARDCGFAAGTFRASPDARAALLADPSAMRTSYGVVWRDGHKPLARGKLELLPRAIRLDGMSGSEPASREIAYDYLSEIRIGRSAAERIDGRPSLMLEPRTGDTLAIASVAQSGVIAEIAERLAALQLGAEGRRRIAVVLPLREEAQEPFGSCSRTGRRSTRTRSVSTAHQVFLTAERGGLRLRVRARRARARAAAPGPGALAERRRLARHLAGPPRIAEDVYSWARPDVRIDESLLPPGLRNGGSVERERVGKTPRPDRDARRRTSFA